MNKAARLWGLGRTAASLLMMSASPLAAQSDSETNEPVIVVTGRGLSAPPAAPAYDTVEIDREQLLTAASGRIEDALASVAGFQQFRRSDSRSSNPSAQGVTLRALGGNATSRALVLLDGVPMADPFFGYIPFSALAPERLGSARITRGGGSGPFGAGALAGTIELTSADAETLGPSAARALIDDRAETELTATLAPRLGEGFAVLSGRRDRGRGFWTTPASQRVPASVRARFESWSAQARAVAPLTGDITLQARLLAYDDRRTLRFAGADTTSQGQDASVRLVGRGDWAFDVLAYVQARNFSNVVVSSTRFVPTLDQRSTPSTGLGGKVEVRPPVGTAHVLRVGADYRRASGILLEDALSTLSGAVTEQRRAGGANTDLGLFVEDDWTLGTVILTAGVRADRTTIRDGFYATLSPGGQPTGTSLYPNRADWSVSARGGALWRVDDRTSLRVAAYTGLRLPTLNELYRPFVVFPVTTQANAALRNERLAGYEAGVDWRPSERASMSITAFENRVDGAIANVTIGPNLRQRQNIDAIRARGIEASAGLALGPLRFDGSLAYTDAQARGSGAAAVLDGRRPSQTPHWAASGTLAWRSATGAVVSTTLRHTGAQFEDDLETDVLPAATTLDAFARVALTERLGLVLRGENLTDTEVVTRNQGGSIDLGAPRTVWAGLEWGF